MLCYATAAPASAEEAMTMAMATDAIRSSLITLVGGMGEGEREWVV